MITSKRKSAFTRRLNRLKALLRAWTYSRYEHFYTSWIDEKVHDPKMLTNCNCPACRRDKYRNHRSSLKREVANELD